MENPSPLTDMPPTSEEVACTDAFQRPKKVVTWVSDQRVVLVSTPAESALFTPEAARKLADNLHYHANTIETKRRAVSFRHR